MCPCVRLYTVHIMGSVYVYVSVSHSPEGKEMTGEKLRDCESLDIKVLFLLPLPVSLFLPIPLPLAPLPLLPSTLSHSLSPPLPLSPHPLQLIDLLRRDLLPSSAQAPPIFLERLTAVLNRGSIHSATDGVCPIPSLSVLSE